MRAYQLQNPLKCKCGSNTYHIDRAPLNGSGPFIDIVVCSNNQCKAILGQVEPSSITNNLSHINKIMSEVAEALEVLNKQLGIQQGTSSQSQAEPNRVSASSAETAGTGSSETASKTTTGSDTPPAADPLSSPPEADQSLG